jgi:hypothetical protein
VRILFAALHNGYYRSLDSVVEELARRGHEIRLGAERDDSAFGGQPIVERLTAAYANVTCGRTPARDIDSLFLPAKIRFAIDYLRYLEPVYSSSSTLSLRARERTPTGMLRLAQSPLLSASPVRRLVSRALDAADRAAPASPDIERFLDLQRPELLVVTPLIGLVASSQIDLLRSARRRGIATAVMVWSWDHLSSKALIRDVPDGLFVWNDVQKREAMQMHGVPEGRIVVTGAQCYDRWFGRAPRRSRAEFVRRAGLPDDRPYVLWACSALLPGTPPEPGTFMRWASQLRRSDNPHLRDLRILLRPHPSRRADWSGDEWRSIRNVAMFGDAPIDDDAREDYFESLYYSSAVVGITTSAFLEAAIVGRPVMSFYADDLVPEHEASLHFQYLVDAEHGLLVMGRDLGEHERQLAAVLAGPPPELLQRQRRFVAHFIRPRGVDVPATTIVADGLERVARAPRTALPNGATAVGRFGWRQLERLEGSPRWRHLVLDERELVRDGRIAAKALIRAEELSRKRAAKQRALAQKRATKRADRRP